MIKAKKSLGQNFLKSPAIAQEIVEAGEIGPDDIILEIGPGKGILTEELLKKAKKVIAVEKDEELVEYLRTKLSDSVKTSKLEIVQGDILLSRSLLAARRDLDNYKIIANIPYYITSRFLRTFLSADNQPNLMVLMVQKEVAERIISKKESLLSISIKSYGKPEIIRKVSAGNFSPAPKIDSAVIKISGISKDFFKKISEKDFFELVKKGFAQKRKLLIRNLRLNSEIFKSCSVPEKARAENLFLNDWKCLLIHSKGKRN